MILCSATAFQKKCIFHNFFIKNRFSKNLVAHNYSSEILYFFQIRIYCKISYWETQISFFRIEKLYFGLPHSTVGFVHGNAKKVLSPVQNSLKVLHSDRLHSFNPSTYSCFNFPHKSHT